MKTNKTLIASAAALAFTLCGPSFGAAHSGHDHSTLPLKWKFAQHTEEKLADTMDSRYTAKVIGLSKFEQKKLDRYGIKVGNVFKSFIAGEAVQVKRTTAGLEINEAVSIDLTSVWQIPLRKTNAVILASTGASQHTGHHHASLPYEWEFSSVTENKIQHRISSSEQGGFIGLNQFEQKLMDRYGIKIGNKFHSFVDGQKVVVERTSGGIHVKTSHDNQSIASALEISNM